MPLAALEVLWQEVKWRPKPSRQLSTGDCPPLPQACHWKESLAASPEGAGILGEAANAAPVGKNHKLSLVREVLLQLQIQGPRCMHHHTQACIHALPGGAALALPWRNGAQPRGACRPQGDGCRTVSLHVPAAGGSCCFSMGALGHATLMPLPIVGHQCP